MQAPNLSILSLHLGTIETHHFKHASTAVFIHPEFLYLSILSCKKPTADLLHLTRGETVSPVSCQKAGREGSPNNAVS